MKKIICIFLTFFNFIIVSNAQEKIEVYFSSCIDGDTAKFVMNNKEIKARFLAIDTPESTKTIEQYGKEASIFTCNKLEEAKKIELEFDPNSNEKDKYDRYLVWVWIDDLLIQSLLINNGLAEVAYLYGDYKYTSLLKEYQKIAKENKIGIWSMEEKQNDIDITTNNNLSEIKNENELNMISDHYIIYYILILLVIIGCIISTSFRKKTIKKIKSKIKRH